MEVGEYVESRDFINTYNKVTHFINNDEVRLYNGLKLLYNFPIIEKIVEVSLTESYRDLFLDSLHEVLLTRKVMLSAI